MGTDETEDTGLERDKERRNAMTPDDADRLAGSLDEDIDEKENEEYELANSDPEAPDSEDREKDDTKEEGTLGEERDISAGTSGAGAEELRDVSPDPINEIESPQTPDISSQAELITLKVKELSGSSFDLERIPLSMLVEELKRKIQDLNSVSPEEQRLIFRGKVLENGKRLSDYKVENDNWIHLVKRDLRNVLQRQNSSLSSVGSEAAVESAGANLGELQGPFAESVSRFLASALGSGGSALEPGRSSTELVSGSATGRNRRQRRSATPGDGNLEHIFQGLATISTLQSTCVSTESRVGSRKRSRPLVTSEVRRQKLDTILDEIETNYSTPEHEQKAIEDNRCDIQARNMRRFQVGQWVDVLDTVNQWLEATIMDISPDGSKVFVHYNAWGERWDEEIDANSNRIAPFRTKTKQIVNCRNLSATPVSWVRAAPTIGGDLRYSLSGTLPRTCEALEELLPLLQNVSYKLGDLSEEERTRKALELAPMLDRMGRVLTDIGNKLADRPRFVRRKNSIFLPGNIISLLSKSVLPFSFFVPERSSLGEVEIYDRSERNELLEYYGYDTQFMQLVQPGIQQMQRAGNLDIHIHAIVTPLSQAGENGQGLHGENGSAFGGQEQEDEEEEEEENEDDEDNLNEQVADENEIRTVEQNEGNDAEERQDIEDNSKVTEPADPSNHGDEQAIQGSPESSEAVSSSIGGTEGHSLTTETGQRRDSVSDDTR